MLAVIIVLAGGFFYMQSRNAANQQPEPVISQAPTQALQDVNNGADDSTVPSENTATPAAGDAMEAVDSTVKTFAVKNDKLTFTPNKMTVKKGDTVKVTFTVTAGTHDWKIDEFDAGTQVLSEGQTETVEFVADKTGTFEFYCSVGNHRQMGMVGSLIVE